MNFSLGSFSLRVFSKSPCLCLCLCLHSCEIKSHLLGSPAKDLPGPSQLHQPTWKWVAQVGDTDWLAKTTCCYWNYSAYSYALKLDMLDILVPICERKNSSKERWRKQENLMSEQILCYLACGSQVKSQHRLKTGNCPELEKQPKIEKGRKRESLGSVSPRRRRTTFCRLSPTAEWQTGQLRLQRRLSRRIAILLKQRKFLILWPCE